VVFLECFNVEAVMSSFLKRLFKTTQTVTKTLTNMGRQKGSGRDAEL
jgi:hypothetical protein